MFISLNAHGMIAWGRLIRQNVEQTRYLATRAERRSDLELELRERRVAVPSGTTLGGRFALRVANTNHRSRREDFDALIEAVLEIGNELVGAGPQDNVQEQ